MARRSADRTHLDRAIDRTRQRVGVTGVNQNVDRDVVDDHSSSAEAESAGTSQAPTVGNAIIPARVVFLTHYIPLYQVRVLQTIARRVKEFHVLLSTPIEPNREFELDQADLEVSVQNTITIRRLWKHRGADLRTSFVDPLFVHVPYDTGSRLKELKPDVVMSLELGARSLGAVRYCQKHESVKSILCTYMSEHTETNRGWFREKLRRYLIRKADAITYNGPSCKRYVTRLGADPGQLYRLAYAADDRTGCISDVRRNESSVRSRLLCVGQLSERKGVLPMLHQLASYCGENPNRKIELRFAGNGPLRQTIENFGRPDNLSLEVLGNIPADQLGAEMMQCGATIAPTLADEWLLVVNEALQAGLPVIGSVHAQAIVTLIRDGCNGWQYDPADSTSLGRGLDHYFEASLEQLAAMRLRCRDSIRHCTPAWAAEGAVRAIADVLAPQTASKRAASGEQR